MLKLLLLTFALVVAFALPVGLAYAEVSQSADSADTDVDVSGDDDDAYVLTQDDFSKADNGLVNLSSGVYCRHDKFKLATDVEGSLSFDGSSWCKTITIDLNGKTITNKSSDNYVIRVGSVDKYVDSEVVANIKNGSVVQEDDWSAVFVGCYDHSTAYKVNFEGVNVSSHVSGSSCVNVPWGYLTVDGGTFDSTGTGSSAIVSADYGVHLYSDFSVVIEDGTFVSDSSVEPIKTSNQTSVLLKGGIYSSLPTQAKLSKDYAVRYIAPDASAADSSEGGSGTSASAPDNDIDASDSSASESEATASGTFKVMSLESAQKDATSKIPIKDFIGTYAGSGALTTETGYVFFFEPDDASTYADAHDYTVERCGYMVDFSVDDNPKWKQVVVDLDTAVSQPDDPIKDNWAFGTWQLNGSDYDFSAKVTSDITLTANWVDSVAEVDGIQYSSLQKAVNKVADAFGDKTVKLLRDTTECVVVKAADAMKLTIDLNGQTLTGSQAEGSRYAVKVLKGNVLVENGAIAHPSDYNAAIWLGEEGSGNNPKLTLKDLDVSTTNQRCIVQNEGTLNIEGGKYSSNYSLCVHLKGGNTTISDGTFEAEKCSVRVEGGSAVVEGGTFSQFIEKREGTAQIDGGSFGDPESVSLLSSGKAFIKRAGSSTYDVVDRSTAIDSAVAWVPLGEYEIFFESLDDAKAYADTQDASVREYEAEYNGKIYPKLKEALEANTGSGSIKLRCDVDESISLSKATNLDLQGHTLSCSTEGASPISVKGGSVSILNGTVSASGAPAISVESGNVSVNASLASTSGTAVSLKDGVLSIDGGTINGEVSLAEGGSGDFSISGGSFDSASYLNKLNSDKKMIKRADSEGTAGRYEVVDESTAVADSNAVVDVVISGKTYKLYFASASEAADYSSEHGGATVKNLVTANISLPENLVYDGEKKEATVTLDGVADGDKVTPNYEYVKGSSSVDAPVDAGNYAVLVTSLSGDDASKYELRPNAKRFFAIEAASIADAKVTLAQTDFTYDGTAKEPEVSSVALGEKALTTDDYKVSGYESNTNAGTGYALVSGKGNYTGTAKASFAIAALNIKGATVSLGDALTYNGSEQTQTVESVTVKSGEKTITLPSDSYVVSDNVITDAGKYTLKVSASSGSNFTGEVTKEFSVAKATPSIEITNPGKKTFGDPSFKLEVIKDADVVIHYVSGCPSVATVSDDGTVTILAAGKSELQVATDATDNYKASGVKTVWLTVDPASIADAKVNLKSDVFTYDGNEKKPEVSSVTVGDTALTTDDCELSGYESNTNAGTGYALVSGKGNYTGTVKAAFAINPAAASITVADPGTKTVGDKFELGATSEPSIALAYKSSDESVVAVSDDGEVTALAAGTAEITVSSANPNYAAEDKKVKLTVEAAPSPEPEPAPTPTPAAADLSAAKVTLSKAAFTYNGKAQKPSVKSVVLNGKTLKEGTDYTASVASGKKVGTYAVTVTAKGSYTGKATTSFVVNPKGVTKFKVSKAKKSFKAKWKKAKAQRSGVQLRYSTKKSMAKAKTVKAKGAAAKAKTVKKLKKKTKYYVQARTYKVVNGKTYYSGWSAKKAVKTK